MSRLADAYKRKRKTFMRMERKMKRSLPLGSMAATTVTLAVLSIGILSLIALAAEGYVSVKKHDLGLDADISIKANVPLNSTYRMVDIVLSHPPLNDETVSPRPKHPEGSTTTSTATTTTTTTFKARHTYTGMTNWFDPETGVGNTPSGNDPGACGRR